MKKDQIIRQFTRDGFHVVTSWDYDESPDLSFLGEYSDKPGEYAIETNAGPRCFAYFNADNVENMDQARENYREMQRIDSGDLSVIGIITTVYREGVELGKDSVWGVITENPSKVNPDDFDTEGEALHHARATLRKLCPSLVDKIRASWAAVRDRFTGPAVAVVLWAYPVACLAWSIYLHVLRPR